MTPRKWRISPTSPHLSVYKYLHVLSGLNAQAKKACKTTATTTKKHVSLLSPVLKAKEKKNPPLVFCF